MFWWRHPALLKTVLVNLKDSDEAVRGVLWQARGPWLVLRNAALVPARGEPIAVDGEVVIERGDVAFVQVFP